MSINPKRLGLASSLCIASLVISSNALAVGGGIVFGVDESSVPARPHGFQADSLDFTYHACTNIVQTPGDPTQVQLSETGYFWISSYQDADSVVDSQINHFLANGYHIYGVYHFEAERVGAYPTPIGNRRDYQVKKGSISLYLDPDQNTMLGLPGCQLAKQGTDDDTLIGGSSNVVTGEKSEKNRLANGDFDVRFSNWMWNDPCPIIRFASDQLVFNANVTRLNGQLDSNHRPEGSGNLYWKLLPAQ